jgi:hypothetical protein
MTFVPVAHTLVDAGKGRAPDTQDYIVANTLKSQRGKAGGGIGPEETLIAAPLSHGSNPNSNAAGRRREDDFNLVAGPLGGGNDGIGRRSQDDPNLVPQTASVRRLTVTECERLQGLFDGSTCSCGGHDDYREALRVVWLADQAEGPQGRTAGAAVALFEQAVLRFCVLHDLEAGTARENSRRWPEARTAGVEATGMRTLRDFEWSDRSASQGREPDEQRARELADALCELPHARSLGDGFARRAREAAADIAARPYDWPQQLSGGVRHFCVCPDSRRYAGLGDAVTATVGHWLGARIRVADEASA